MAAARSVALPVAGSGSLSTPGWSQPRDGLSGRRLLAPFDDASSPPGRARGSGTTVMQSLLEDDRPGCELSCKHPSESFSRVRGTNTPVGALEGQSFHSRSYCHTGPSLRRSAFWRLFGNEWGVGVPGA